MRRRRIFHPCVFLVVLQSLTPPIIRENGWSKSCVDSLLSRLDENNAEISKSDRSSINIAVKKWIFKHKGMFVATIYIS
jgi:hypothetical protein